MGEIVDRKARSQRISDEASELQAIQADIQGRQISDPELPRLAQDAEDVAHDIERDVTEDREPPPRADAR